MGKSFGQSFGDSFAKTLPDALQSFAQLSAVQQQRDMQLGLQYESQKNQRLNEAAVYESKGDFANADKARQEAAKYGKMSIKLYGGDSDPLSGSSSVSVDTSSNANNGTALGNILSAIPQTILHPVQTAKTVKNVFSRNKPTQEPIQNPEVQTTVNNNQPQNTGTPRFVNPETQRAYEESEAKKQAETQSLDLAKKQIPPVLHGDADAIIQNPGLSSKEKLDNLQQLSKIQNQFIPDPKDSEFFDESQNLIEAIDTAKSLLQSDKTLSGLNSFGNTSKNYRQYTQQLQRIDSILKNRKLAPGKESKGINLDTITPLSGWQGLIQGDNDAINKLDLIREQALGDYTQKRDFLKSQGKKLGVYDNLDLSTPEKIAPKQDPSMVNDVQPSTVPLKDFKNPKKVKSMIDSGMIDFKSAGDMINMAIKSSGADLEKPVPLKQQGIPKETVQIPGGAEVVFQGQTRPSLKKKKAPVQPVTKPAFAQPAQSQPQVQPTGDPVEQELNQYYKDGTLPKGRPGKGNVSSNSPKPGSQAHFINTLAKTAPSLQTITTLANTLKRNNGAGINKDLIAQLDEDGATLLDLAFRYLENEGQAVA
jgi:hypothetical protein